MPARIFFVLLLIAALAACSSSPERPADEATLAAERSDDDLICKRYKKIGSNRIHKRCVTREQARAEEEQQRLELDRNIGRSGTVGSGG